MIADIDPHPELDAAIGRHIGISLRRLALHFDGATYRVDDARKLDKQAVARSLDDATAMFLDFGVGQLAPKRLQPRERPFLIRPHQARIPRHVRRENCREPTLDATSPCGLHGASPVVDDPTPTGARRALSTRPCSSLAIFASRSRSILCAMMREKPDREGAPPPCWPASALRKPLIEDDIFGLVSSF